MAKLKAQAWKIFSLWIRKRDNWTCYTCHKKYPKGTMGLHAGHFISRTHNSTFFSEMNVHAQCAACNLWKYGNVGEYAAHLIEDYGEEEFKKLLTKGREIKKFSREELEEIIGKYGN